MRKASAENHGYQHDSGGQGASGNGYKAGLNYAFSRLIHVNFEYVSRPYIKSSEFYPSSSFKLTASFPVGFQ